MSCPNIGSLSSSTANQRAAQNNYRAYGCQDLYFLNFVACMYNVYDRKCYSYVQNLTLLPLWFHWLILWLKSQKYLLPPFHMDKRVKKITGQGSCKTKLNSWMCKSYYIHAVHTGSYEKLFIVSFRKRSNQLHIRKHHNILVY